MKLYYRGTAPNETKRIRTGCDAWDDNLFCADNKRSAECYGSQIEVIMAKPEAITLKEGTKEFNKIFKKPKKLQNILEWCTIGIISARELGYDIVEFEKQTDIGTVILNTEIVVRNYELEGGCCYE